MIRYAILKGLNKNTNGMQAKKTGNSINYKLHLAVIILAVLALVGGAGIVHADKYDVQINALRAQNANIAGMLNGLMEQAGSYQAVINQLQGQIDSVQAQISASEAQQAQLQAQITADQQQLDHERSVLANAVKTMYVDGTPTTIEQLASSKNLSDFVDKEEYRTAVQNQIQDTVKKIAALQAQLQAQKLQVDQLLASQRQQQAQLASDQQQQDSLLTMNEDQQNQYNQQISANSSQISSLRAQQLAANSRFYGGSYAAGSGPACGGGYPGIWCNAPKDSVIDSWGMYNRECVSYTAFKVAASGRYMPYWGGRGNANQWPGDAQAAGIPMDYGGGARPGDVAISTAGTWGHAMYVESVNGNGTINISQYNVTLDGTYSTRSGVSESGLYFIHF